MFKGNCESNKTFAKKGDDKVSNDHLKWTRGTKHGPSQSLPVDAKKSRLLKEALSESWKLGKRESDEQTPGKVGSLEPFHAFPVAAQEYCPLCKKASKDEGAQKLT